MEDNKTPDNKTVNSSAASIVSDAAKAASAKTAAIKAWTTEKIKSIFASDEEEKWPNTLPLLLRKRAEEAGDLPLLICKNEIGETEKYSYRRVYSDVVGMASALSSLGIKRGSLVGLVADNRREWFVLDMAILSLGASDVPRGCDSTGREIASILNFTQAAVCIFENKRQLHKLLSSGTEIPHLRTAILIDSPDEAMDEAATALGINIIRYVNLEDNARHATVAQKEQAIKEMDAGSGEEIATIIFTSGTTGQSKGVMLSHANYMAQCRSSVEVFCNAKEGDVWLSVLPVWHSFERAFQYIIVTLKNSIAYSKPAASVMLADMNRVKPNWMIGVPRLWDSLAHGIYREMKKARQVTRVSFNIAVKVGRAYSWAKAHVKALSYRYRPGGRFVGFLKGLIPFVLLAPVYGISTLVVFRKVRKRLGGITCGISGGGSLQGETGAFWRAVGLNLIEGYGMTEASPIISMGNPLRPIPDCAGTVWPGMQARIVKIHSDGTHGTKPLRPGKRGAIEVRGAQVMKGYYKRDDLTARAISAAGWLDTGDIGVLTYDNEIRITGRSKDTIVLLGGENIEPAPIENALCESPFILRAFVVGQDKKCIAAIIVCAQETLTEWADTNRLMYPSWEGLLELNEVQLLYRSEIDSRVGEKTGFRTCERISRFVLLPEDFTTGKELNAKGTIVRANALKIHEKTLRSLFPADKDTDR